MANVMASPTNFQRRINNYVPAMMYSSEVNWNGFTRVTLGAPAAASATAILSAQSIAATGTVDISSVAINDPWGRNVQVVASGASTATFTVYGWDYLGQPMREDFTANGATPVLGKKAFKTLQSFVINTTTAATTINLGTGVQLGLPYKTLKAEAEILNGALATTGTLTAPVLTDPATATTGDPRGTYATNGTMNGTNIYSVVVDCVNDVNTSNNGGLHGIRHYYA